MQDDRHPNQVPAAADAPPQRRRRLVWRGLLVVVVPLLVLLGLQFWWLVDLQQASAVARRAALVKYLERVSKEIRFFYLPPAERALNLPPEILDPKYVRKIAWMLDKNQPEGAARLFVINFRAEGDQRLMLFDPAAKEMMIPSLEPSEITAEVRAIFMAVAPWSILRQRGDAVFEAKLVAEDRDPDHRMILNPILDEGSQLVGLAGLIVDETHFREQVLPQAIRSARPAVFAEDELIVEVLDGDGGRVLATDPEAGRGEIGRKFSFLFTDWKIAVRGRTSTSAQWARANFALNLTLSIVLGAVLLGGLGVVLRAAARELHLSEMKSDFVSNVSHELRTPLASIRVFGELLGLGRVTEPGKVREYGKTIETESRRLTQLIDNILDFSRIESGRKIYHFESADLEQIAAGVLETLTVRLRRRGFQIELERPAAPLPELRLDPDAIRQALFNLLDNAVKYSGDGRDIRLRIQRQGDQAVVTVRDHGIGISKQEQQKIFERFHRVGTGLVHDVKGAGLGLAIVQHIARAHNGEVTVESEPGRGSAFSIRLPISSPAKSADRDDAEERDEAPEWLQQTG